MTLALARQRALENAQAIAEGRDPRRRATRQVPTLAEACETVIAIYAGSWKPGGRNEENWRSTLRDHVFPRLANMPVDAVTGTDVMAVLLLIWTTKQETAGRVRRRICAVMKWAVAQGYRTGNPAGDAISAALPNNNAQVTHRAALPHAQVGAAVAKVRRSGAYRGAVLSFERRVVEYVHSLPVLRSGPASATGSPSAPRRRGRSASSPWPTSTATASRPPCSKCRRILMQQWSDYLSASV